MHTRVPEIKSLMSLKTVPKLDTHSATVLHLLRQPVHRRGSDSNHGLGLDTLFIDTHEQNFIRRLLPLGGRCVPAHPLTEMSEQEAQTKPTLSRIQPKGSRQSSLNSTTSYY